MIKLMLVVMFNFKWISRNQFTLHRTVSTIFALSSGHGKSGLAVVRISGPLASNTLMSLRKEYKLPKPRRATLTPFLYNPKSDDVLDAGCLVLWFPGPASFTGEDCVELHVHGGPAVVSSVLACLGSLDGLRLAQPGEFTRRAFWAGKLNLLQVEALADVISAESEAQKRLALFQLNNQSTSTFMRGLHGTSRFSNWTKTLTKIAADVEAFIDFSESENLREDEILKDVAVRCQKLIDAIKGALIEDGQAGERLTAGTRVAIFGPPNAGKSSLLNVLTSRQAAIVSPIPGTTRDAIEIRLDVGGWPVQIVDTAGLRQHESVADEIEAQGAERARQIARAADVVLLVFDVAVLTLGQLQWFLSSLMDSKHNVKSPPKVIVVANKSDLQSNAASLFETLNPTQEKYRLVFTSCTTGSGLDCLALELRNIVESLCTTQTGHMPIITRVRHRIHLERVVELLRTFNEDDHLDWAHRSYYLRLSLDEMGMLTGKVSSEKILDVIFADFCIGK